MHIEYVVNEMRQVEDGLESKKGLLIRNQYGKEERFFLWSGLTLVQHGVLSLCRLPRKERHSISQKAETDLPKTAKY